MNHLFRVTSIVALLTTASIANASITGDVTGGGAFSDDVSTADGWVLNNPASNGVDFWTLTIDQPGYLSVNVGSQIDFGISVYQGSVSDSVGFAFDNAASFRDPITSELGTFIDGTPNFGFAGSTLEDVFLATAGTYTIAVGGSDFGFSGPYQYEMTVNVSAVPLPAAVWLFLTGLTALAGWSRRYTAA
ncbi:uncharacterized protein sS8_3617 [Methylocaldum marinum]|uniref:Uncharacterized protein n=1 Tax=Methylocaldum marinum TaxID=1432792 RepID=A0A250KVM4_9GAMM|nr:VPLPA-CTERM sorting domain-containing protein [Methylocaldum marinum]BBA35554.1 uncharacterized protein sS8_3617 [Methylocaldum marinum]